MMRAALLGPEVPLRLPLVRRGAVGCPPGRLLAVILTRAVILVGRVLLAAAVALGGVVVRRGAVLLGRAESVSCPVARVPVGPRVAVAHGVGAAVLLVPVCLVGVRLVPVAARSLRGPRRMGVGGLLGAARVRPGSQRSR